MQQLLTVLSFLLVFTNCTDVDSDTSSESGVGTSPDVSDDELLPVAEECCKQEEEDPSSVCSVEYHYSEEEYYQSGGDLDDDVRDKEVGMTNSTATEQSTEIVSITEVEHEKGLWNGISDSDKEDYSPPKPRPVCLPPVRKDLVYRPKCRKKPPLGPQFEIWVNSWEVKNHQTRYAWVNVYAHYNKNKGYGGYGVVLRDWHAKPVTASAMGSDPSLVPLAREIKARAPKGQDLDDLLGYPRGLNKAARYLAKMEKKKAEIQPDIEDEGGMVPPGDEWPAEIQPGDFPEKLKVMLFEQAFGMKYYNDLSGW
ncbi:hypothetical protein C5167_037649 [Papaver somniferum]|uniref:Uncharacterized protein n=1 Tax=Papaver somniferum TaxID=3469 RepID=A0A4Y7IAM0_PAPSO|nr:hypothetical protein C5167_037649 [Papaver somniferum]